MTRINVEVNGRSLALEVCDNELLIEMLRERLGLLGTKAACLEGSCGACTVLVNDRSVLSCLMLAVDADGARVLTIEGLAQGEKMHPLQQSFMDKGAVQCGFCTPGMILAAKALLDVHPDPDEEEIKRGLDGNLCRCTGYVKIFDAVRDGAKRMKE